MEVVVRAGDTSSNDNDCGWYWMLQWWCWWFTLTQVMVVGLTDDGSCSGIISNEQNIKFYCQIVVLCVCVRARVHRELVVVVDGDGGVGDSGESTLTTYFTAEVKTFETLS